MDILESAFDDVHAESVNPIDDLVIRVIELKHAVQIGLIEFDAVVDQTQLLKLLEVDWPNRLHKYLHLFLFLLQLFHIRFGLLLDFVQLLSFLFDQLDNVGDQLLLVLARSQGIHKRVIASPNIFLDGGLLLNVLEVISEQEQDDELHDNFDCEILHFVGVDAVAIFQIISVVDGIESFN